MAIDNRLQVFNEEDQSVDYDILASDVKFLPDGKDLPTKLAEMETQIGEAGSGDGTVTGVKMNNGSPIEPDGDGVVDLGTVITQHQDISGKVDKNGTDSLMSAAEHTKLAGIEAGAEKNIIKGIKANGASTNLPVDQNGVVELPPAGSTISPATASPSMDGTANVGSSDKYAREDHVHPHDSTKANASDVYSKTQADTLLSGKQNTLTFDNAPTAGSNNPVKSGGIKTALDAKADAADVPTKTEMATAIDDALGEAEVTVVPANSVGIITSLGSDSNSDALAASMGKKLKIAILQIYSSLGVYAFPNGKPNLDFDDIITYSVAKTIGTGLSASGVPTEVLSNQRLEVTIAITDNLYIIDDDSVEVTMGGQPVAGAWNASTMKVTIAAVTGNVVINVPSLTYVSSGLVSMFDGKNRGGTTGEWADYIVPQRILTLTNCTENTDNVAFNGTSSTAFAKSSTSPYDGVEVEETAGTIEGVFKSDTLGSDVATYPFVNAKFSNKKCLILTVRNSSSAGVVAGFTQDADSSGPQCWLLGQNDYTKSYLSVSNTRAYFNGVSLSRANAISGISTHQYSKMAAFCFINSSNVTQYRKGSLYCIRIYSRTLTEAEVLQNYKVDQKRFNIS